MKILLSVDDSVYSEAATDVLIARDWPDKSTFKVISVLEEGADKTGKEASGDIPPPGSPGAVQSMLERVAERLKQRFPQAQVEREVLYGNPKEKILDCASEWSPDLVAVGSHGRTGLTRILLGSVSQTLLLYSDCSTLIVRLPQSEQKANSLAKPPERILIPLDASEHSRRALDWVLSLGWAESSKFKILTVLPPLAEKFSDGLALLQGEDLSAERLRAEDEAKRILEESKAKLSQHFGADRVSGELLEGDAADMILRVANGWPAALIVMGTRGHGGLKRLWLGSVSQEIVLQATCPVEVVKKPASESGNG